MKLYHSTSLASAALILRDGFNDSALLDVAFGVFLADRPLDHGDDVARHANCCLEVRVPDGFELGIFELIEDDRPLEAYREWIIPAEIVNTWVRIQLEGEGPWDGGVVPLGWAPVN